MKIHYFMILAVLACALIAFPVSSDFVNGNFEQGGGSLTGWNTTAGGWNAVGSVSIGSSSGNHYAVVDASACYNSQYQMDTNSAAILSQQVDFSQFSGVKFHLQYGIISVGYKNTLPSGEDTCTGYFSPVSLGGGYYSVNTSAITGLKWFCFRQYVASSGDCEEHMDYIDNVTFIVSTPTSSFTAIPQSGPAPLLVSFQDTSTYPGGSGQWNHWDFGNGYTVNNNSAPNMTYFSNGNYTVNLTVGDSSGNASSTKIIQVGYSNPNQTVTQNGFTFYADTSSIPAYGTVNVSISNSFGWAGGIGTTNFAKVIYFGSNPNGNILQPEIEYDWDNSGILTGGVGWKKIDLTKSSFDPTRASSATLAQVQHATINFDGVTGAGYVAVNVFQNSPTIWGDSYNEIMQGYLNIIVGSVTPPLGTMPLQIECFDAQWGSPINYPTVIFQNAGNGINSTLAFLANANTIAYTNVIPGQNYNYWASATGFSSLTGSYYASGSTNPYILNINLEPNRIVPNQSGKYYLDVIVQGPTYTPIYQASVNIQSSNDTQTLSTSGLGVAEFIVNSGQTYVITASASGYTGRTTTTTINGNSAVTLVLSSVVTPTPTIGVISYPMTIRVIDNNTYSGLPAQVILFKDLTQTNYIGTYQCDYSGNSNMVLPTGTYYAQISYSGYTTLIGQAVIQLAQSTVVTFQLHKIPVTTIPTTSPTTQPTGSGNGTATPTVTRTPMSSTARAAAVGSGIDDLYSNAQTIIDLAIIVIILGLIGMMGKKK